MQSRHHMIPRRNLLKTTALGLGLQMGSLTGVKGPQVCAATPALSDNVQPRLPREVWLASVSCDGIESCSADVKISQVLEEYELKTFDEHMKEAETMQKTRRL